MEKQSFKPFIPAHKSIPELTFTSIIFGILLAIVFGVVNAYLGLKVGMTISASIPAAVVSMSVTRVIMKRDSILENNMIQTIASAGESLTAGAIFTIPAIFLWSKSSGLASPSYILITLIGLVGGLLGVMFMIPLRRALIVKEHDVLPYPEGSACADVLLAGEEGGGKAAATFKGMLAGAVFKMIIDVFKWVPSRIDIKIKTPIHTELGFDALPALLGVGFIIGKKVAGYMLSGSLFGWIIVIPLISMIGDQNPTVLFPATVPIHTLTIDEIWHHYIRYIGAGAVAFGGFISLIKSIPLIIMTFIESIQNYREIDNGVIHMRTERDIPMSTVVIVVLVTVVFMAVLDVFQIGFLGAIFVALFGFFFATVSSRIVGLIGNSSNPVSGMTLATLIFAAFIYKFLGYRSDASILSVFIVGSIVCIIIAIAGDTSQDLKTGYLVGATPYKQQIGELIGVVTMSVVLGAVLFLFDMAWGFGSHELPAPQATLVKVIVEGVIDGRLPWALIFIGIAFGVILEILGLPVLPVAIGLYLPIHLTSTIMIGGVIRGWVEHKEKHDLFIQKQKCDTGILYASGLIAGEGIIGVFLALLYVLGIDLALGINFGVLGTMVIFSFVILGLLRTSVFLKVNKNDSFF